MGKSYCQSASDVRKNWSTTIDSVVRKGPVFISRTHDNVALLDEGLLLRLLESYRFHVLLEQEDDGCALELFS